MSDAIKAPGHALFAFAHSLDSRRSEIRSRRSIAKMRGLSATLLADIGLSSEDIEAALSLPVGCSAAHELSRRQIVKTR